MSNSSISIIIPTYNRYDRLIRLLKYYESYNNSFKIIICDSSSDTLEDYDDFKKHLKSYNIDYYTFDHSTPCYKKIFKSLDYIKTKYVLLCADDDFISPKGIIKSEEFLEQNTDYTAALGKTISYIFHNNEIKCRMADTSAHSIESNNYIDRFKEQLFARYKTSTFYAVHRTDFFKYIYSRIQNYTDCYTIVAEQALALLTAIHGKVKIIDVFYSIRECHHPLKYSNQTYFHFLENGQFDEKYNSLKKLLVEELCKQDPSITKSTGEKIIDNGMKELLGAPLFYFKIKFKLKSILKNTTVYNILINIKRKIFKQNLLTTELLLANAPAITYQNPSHPDYKEFMKIREIIERHGV